jgi:hypothetical protein
MIDIALGEVGVIWRFSYNMATPKSSILIGFAIANLPFWGTPIFGKPHIGWPHVLPGP